MIQFNLLPDIKLEYLKTRRTKRTVMLIASAVSGSIFVIFLLIFLTVNVLQKQHLNNLNADIKRDSNTLQSIDGIDRILTVQNQLNKLTELHDSKPVASRLKEYLTQITPAQVSYASIDIDFTQSFMKFTGAADSLKTVNQFVDTLKFTKYTANESEDQKNAFSEVVLSDFGKDDKGASYSIILKFDPEIFSSQTNAQLVVPNIITTRSSTERPDEDILRPLSNTLEDGGL